MYVCTHTNTHTLSLSHTHTHTHTHNTDNDADVDPSAARDSPPKSAPSPRRQTTYITPQVTVYTRTSSPRLEIDVGASQGQENGEEGVLSPRGRPPGTYPLTALL